MFCATFSNGKWWPSWNTKLQKIKTSSFKKHSGTNLDQFQPMVLEICHVCVYAIFSNRSLAAILKGIFLFNFETAQCKNHFDINLV